ncbi:MAG: SNF2-related protein [Thermoprotei archaeon]
MPKIDYDYENYLVLLKKVLDPLIKYNPFLNLFYNPLTGRVEKTSKYNRYENFLHQIILYTDAISRSNLRVLIGDEVGLGKTVEALRLIKYLLLIGEIRRILVIVPRNIIRQWIYHDLKELLWSPRHIVQINRRLMENFEEKVKYYNSIEDPVIMIGSMDLIKYGLEDRRGTSRFRPYYEFVSSINWDLVVVDEVHRLGFTTTGKKSLRTTRLSKIIASAPNTILLSATPSRGTHKDFIGRLSLVMEHLSKHKRGILSNSMLRDTLYRSLSDFIYYRRNKEYVNRLEDKPVFPKLSVYMALIELGVYKELYEELEEIISKILRITEKEHPLLKIILLKRALSSPYAFLKTLNKIISKQRTSESIRRRTTRIEDYEDFVEREVDALIESSLVNYSDKLRVFENQVSRLLRAYRELYKVGDPATKALYLLIKYIVEERSELPEELIGSDLIVFSEYLDTVSYLFDKLYQYFVEDGFYEDIVSLRRIVEKTLGKFCNEIRHTPGLCKNPEKTVDKMLSYVRLLRRGTISVVLVCLSSKNIRFLPLFRRTMIEAEYSLKASSVTRVLLSTDIASEGLNLEFFNVVVNYDIPWSPVRREQRIGRVYRLRQERNCVVIDLVRNTRHEYEIYHKFLQKLFNMIEQHITPYPIEEIILLKPFEFKGFDEGVKVLTDIDMAEAIIRSIVYGELTFDDALRILLDKVREFRDLVESSGKGFEPPDYITKKLEEIYGCSNHYEALDTITRLYKLLYGVKPHENELSSILVNVYNKLRGYEGEDLLLFTKDGDIDLGVIVFAKIVNRRGITKYVFPVMILKHVNDNYTVYKGLGVLRKIIDLIDSHKLVVHRASEKMVLHYDELDRLVSISKRLAETVIGYIQGKHKRKIGELVKLGIISEDEKQELIDDLNVEVIEKAIPILPAGIISEEPSVEAPPEEVKHEIELLSTEYIIEYFTHEKGCRILEKHVGEKYPYDLLIECPEKTGYVQYKIEVKGRKPRKIAAELSASEIDEAEKDPSRYIICIVANMREDKDKWIRYCEDYEHIPKKIIEKKIEKRERRAFVGLHIE